MAGAQGPFEGVAELRRARVDLELARQFLPGCHPNLGEPLGDPFGQDERGVALSANRGGRAGDRAKRLRALTGEETDQAAERAELRAARERVAGARERLRPGHRGREQGRHLPGASPHRLDLLGDRDAVLGRQAQRCVDRTLRVADQGERVDRVVEAR